MRWSEPFSVPFIFKAHNICVREGVFPQCDGGVKEMEVAEWMDGGAAEGVDIHLRTKGNAAVDVGKTKIVLNRDKRVEKSMCVCVCLRHLITAARSDPSPHIGHNGYYYD